MKEQAPLTASQSAMVEDAMPLARWTIYKYIVANENVVGLSYDDLLQEAYLALCKAAIRYIGGRAMFKTYAVTVMHNHLLDYCRKINLELKNIPCYSLDAPGQTEVVEADMSQERSCEESSLEQEVLSQAWVKEFLKERKAAYRGCAQLGIEALELKVLYGYGVTDIAPLFEVKPTLVGAWISRAKAKIKKDMAAPEWEAMC